MKYSSKIYASLIAMIVAMGACSENNEIENSEQISGDKTPYQNVDAPPRWFQQFKEQMQKLETVSSVDWEVDETSGVFDHQTSMAIFTSIPEYYSIEDAIYSRFNREKDRLAAFVGDECRGVATCEISDDGIPHFNLLVRRKESDKEDLKFVLKSFTEYWGMIMVSEPFVYQNNGSLGTYANPYKVKWTNRTENGYYIFNISYRVKVPWTPSDKDYYILEDQNGNLLGWRGKISNDDDLLVTDNIKTDITEVETLITTTKYPIVTFKYYRAEENRIYTVKTSVDLAEHPNIGPIEIKI